MDRFIEAQHPIKACYEYSLKSNMDRFIGKQNGNFSLNNISFKIQYG